MPKNSNNTWTVEIEQDGEDLILPFPEDMLQELDWKEGDVLKWIDKGDGTFSLSKQPYDSDSGLTENLE